MFNAFERKIAFRYLRSRKRDRMISVMAGFSFVGIMLGVATLIIVMAVMTGMRQEFLSRVLAFNGHISVYSLSERSIKDFDTHVATLKKQPMITDVIPTLEQQALVTVRSLARGVHVVATRPADLTKKDLISGHISEGQIFKDNDQSVGIGQIMAEKMGLHIGDKITFVVPNGHMTPFGMAPKMASYPVAFIFNAGHREYDSNVVFLPLSLGQTFFNLEKQVTTLEVFCTSADQASSIERSISNILGPTFRTLDWQRANTGFSGALQVQQNVMFIILSLIVLIAAFNIISSLIMLVQQKSRDIAILRTIGTRRGAIMRIFFMIGGSIGMIGTSLGLILGLLISLNIDHIRLYLEKLSGWKLFHDEIFWLTKLPAVVVPHDVMAVVMMALGLSFLSTLYPAWRAARMDPVEAMRYE